MKHIYLVAMLGCITGCVGGSIFGSQKLTSVHPVCGYKSVDRDNGIPVLSNNHTKQALDLLEYDPSSMQDYDARCKSYASCLTLDEFNLIAQSDHDHNNLFHRAVMRVQPDTVRLLVEKGFAKNRKNKYLRTPFDDCNLLQDFLLRLEVPLPLESNRFALLAKLTTIQMLLSGVQPAQAASSVNE